jgi:hypothetical protein
MDKVTVASSFDMMVNPVMSVVFTVLVEVLEDEVLELEDAPDEPELLDVPDELDVPEELVPPEMFALPTDAVFDEEVEEVALEDPE